MGGKKNYERYQQDIVNALHYDWRMTEVARRIGVNLKTLEKWLERYPDFNEWYYEKRLKITGVAKRGHYGHPESIERREETKRKRGYYE